MLGDTKVDYHASFGGNQKMWGYGSDVETAAGNCLLTASSLSDLGQKAWSGQIAGIDARRVD